MRPIPPTPKSTKERTSKLELICDRGESRFWDQTFPPVEFAKNDSAHGSIDWNSRTSSFKEEGTDVGRKRMKPR